MVEMLGLSLANLHLRGVLNLAHSVDGRNPAPPKCWTGDSPDSPVNTNKQWFGTASRWCEMDFAPISMTACYETRLRGSSKGIQPDFAWILTAGVEGELFYHRDSLGQTYLCTSTVKFPPFQRDIDSAGECLNFSFQGQFDPGSLEVTSSNISCTSTSTWPFNVKSPPL